MLKTTQNNAFIPFSKKLRMKYVLRPMYHIRITNFALYRWVSYLTGIYMYVENASISSVSKSKITCCKHLPLESCFKMQVEHQKTRFNRHLA
jgi:hypothetical protein